MTDDYPQNPQARFAVSEDTSPPAPLLPGSPLVIAQELADLRAYKEAAMKWIERYHWHTASNTRGLWCRECMAVTDGDRGYADQLNHDKLCHVPALIEGRVP